MPIPLGILAVAGAGAAGGASSFDLLETTVLSSGASSVEFTGLGSYSAYKHLQIRMVQRNDGNDGVNRSAELRLRINGDTGNNYAAHVLYGFPSTGVFSDARINTSSMFVYYGSPTAVATANAFAATIVDILDFSSTSKTKTVRGLHGVHFGSGTPNSSVVLHSGFRNNTAAITSITIFNGDNYNFIAGSRFSLYGIK